MILIASWTRHQDPSTEEPASIRWENGSVATIADYRQHELDTHTIIDDHPDRVEKHIFPGIVAEVVYDTSKGSWTVRGRGVNPASLELTDPQAKDEEIQAELYTFPIVYRATIIR